MKYFIKSLGVLSILVLGIIAGLMIDNIPYIVLKKEIGLGELANFIMALIVTIVVPILLTKWLNDERHIKDFLITEIQCCIQALESIKTKIDEAVVSGNTNKADIKLVLSKFNVYDLKIKSLCHQLEISYKRKSKAMRNDLISESLTYWKETTGGDLMNDNFSFDQSYFKTHNIAFSKLESFLKGCVHSVNQF